MVALSETVSTNDEAARLRERGETGPLVVVAARQTAGRGRGGASFVSPEGGLYASALVSVPSDALPAFLVGATGVAMAEAIEEVAGCPVRLKWPNDLWIEGKKAGGILVEAGSSPAQGRATVIVGVGVNVRGVPAGLPPEIAAATTAVDLHARNPVRLEDLLAEFLAAFGRRVGGLDDALGRSRLEADFRARAALLGERVRYFVGGVEESGRLADVALGRGILVEREGLPAAWRPGAHVRDLRHSPR